MLEESASILKNMLGLAKKIPAFYYIAGVFLISLAVIALTGRNDPEIITIGVLGSIGFAILLLLLNGLTKSRKLGKHLRVGSLYLLYFTLLVFSIFVVRFTLEAIGIAKCKHLTGDGSCSTDLVKVEAVITPIIRSTETKTFDRFSYRRSSCSNSTNNVWKGCLDDSTMTITSVTATNAGGRNYGIRFENADPETGNHCGQIGWRATSGGRTAIGECRYHGAISFTPVISGEKTQPGESEKKSLEVMPGEIATISYANQKNYDGIVHFEYVLNASFKNKSWSISSYSGDQNECIGANINEGGALTVKTIRECF